MCFRLYSANWEETFKNIRLVVLSLILGSYSSRRSLATWPISARMHPRAPRPIFNKGDNYEYYEKAGFEVPSYRSPQFTLVQVFTREKEPYTGAIPVLLMDQAYGPQTNSHVF